MGTTSGCLWGEGGGLVVRLRTKGGKFSDMKLSENFARSLRSWLEFAEAVQGVRLRTGSLDFAASPYVFPGRDVACPFFSADAANTLPAARSPHHVCLISRLNSRRIHSYREK